MRASKAAFDATSREIEAIMAENSAVAPALLRAGTFYNEQAMVAFAAKHILAAERGEEAKEGFQSELYKAGLRRGDEGEESEED